MGKLFEKAIIEAKTLSESKQQRIGLELISRLSPTIAFSNPGWDVPLPDSEQETKRPVSLQIWAVRNIEGSDQRVSGSNRLVSIRIGFHGRQIGVVLTGVECPWRKPGKVDPVLWFWSGHISDFEALFATQ